MRLAGKISLVTGAADERSIGWGIARGLAREGASVVLNDLPSRISDLEERAAFLRDQGCKAAIAPADVRDPDAVNSMVQAAVGEMGRLDILCSNAGIIRWQHFLDITPDVMRHQIDVNIKGNMFVCQAAAKKMIMQGGNAKIILTSSVQNNYYFPLTPVYGATRNAMNIFVGALALELAPHKITVNHIGPGWAETAINDASPELNTAEDFEKQKEAIPLRRSGTPDEMAEAVLYFVSEKANYTTGAFLRVDGGLGIGKYTY